jgi:hypothetical protein
LLKTASILLSAQAVGHHRSVHRTGWFPVVVFLVRHSAKPFHHTNTADTLLSSGNSVLRSAWGGRIDDAVL